MNEDLRSTTPSAPPLASPVALQPPSPTSAQPQAEDRLEEQSESHVAEQEMEINAPQSRLPRPANTRTPEPLASRPAQADTDQQRNGHIHAAPGTQATHLLPERSSTPSTPSSLPPFDWDDLESRFEKALAQANENEQELMAEFEALVKVILIRQLFQDFSTRIFAKIDGYV